MQRRTPRAQTEYERKTCAHFFRRVPIALPHGKGATDALLARPNKVFLPRRERKASHRGYGQRCECDRECGKRRWQCEWKSSLGSAPLTWRSRGIPGHRREGMARYEGVGVACVISHKKKEINVRPDIGGSIHGRRGLRLLSSRRLCSVTGSMNHLWQRNVHCLSVGDLLSLRESCMRRRNE